MGDNIEHVITYWVMWELFESPLLAGFAVISHWLPHLLFSVYFGSLADRYDCRRIIQTAQVMFILASVGWGVVFVTGHAKPGDTGTDWRALANTAAHAKLTLVIYMGVSGAAHI